ncbi:MAG: glycosyltransferase family A protein [Syntrophobacteraceae bacterium]|nr:glycosyltransferase family A protein [Syntrophobacteraceae bacterium]
MLTSLPAAAAGRYVLVSACRNEAAYIEGLIGAVSAQTRKPLRWVIVDDNSTDETSAVAMARGKELEFFQLARMSDDRPRNFASKVFAEQHGYELVRHLEFEFVGFLDADILLPEDYYEQVIDSFKAEPDLGLAGGVVLDREEGRVENSRKGSENHHVAGGVQLFRRRCFDQIGGYRPIKGGCEDTVAEVMSIMHGWKVRTFPSINAIHLRPDGFVRKNPFQAGMAWGSKFYRIGYHPAYYTGQCLRRIGRRPIIVGSLFSLFGFIIASLKAEPRPVSKDFVRFLRKMQARRITEALNSVRLLPEAK